MDELKIYLASPPELAAEAALYGPVSAMSYRVGRDLRLYRAGSGGAHVELMDVDASSFQGWGPHEALVSALTRECRRMGCRGIVLDLPRPNARLCAFCALLDGAAHRQGLRLYLSERYARCATHSIILTPAQNTSGTYSDRLEKLISHYGPERVALEAERVYTDYPLPCRTGRGSVVMPRDLPADLLKNARFSPQLCANYAAYISAGRPHLVLWDDLATLREKLRIAKAAGIREVFLYYPHVSDILEKLTVLLKK